MSSVSSLGFLAFPFPAKVPFTELLHNFSAHGERLGSFSSEIIAIGVVGEVIPGSVHNTSPSQGTRSPGIHYPASHHVAALMPAVGSEQTQTRVRAAGRSWEVLA